MTLKDSTLAIAYILNRKRTTKESLKFSFMIFDNSNSSVICEQLFCMAQNKSNR